MPTATTTYNIPAGLSEKDEALWFAEEEARSLARGDLLRFVKYTMPRYRINWHHRIIADAFERFARREAMRLIIVAPPRTGKSQLISRHGPAWLLGINPDARVVCTSHTANLASNMSADVRKLMVEPTYRELFPETRVGALKIKGEAAVKDRSDEWDLLGGKLGGVKSVGRGGGLAGFDADYAIIDDPFKNRKEAKSKTIRDEAWDWLMDDVLMRLGNAGPCLIMHTRWDDDDLIGRIEDRMKRDPDAEQWEIIYLPAEMDEPAYNALYPAVPQANMPEGMTAAPARPMRHPKDPRKIGECLWPWYYGGKKDGQDPQERKEKCAAYMKRWKKNPIGWASLAQQRPQPAGTKIFPVERITIVKAVDSRIQKTVRYWDNAGTKDAGCFTAGVKVSKLAGGSYDGFFMVEHVERFQEEALRREQIKKATAKRDGIGTRQCVEQEPGSSGKDVAMATQRNMVGYIVDVDKVSGDKEFRAGVAATQVQGGNVIMLEGIWNQDFLDELKNWPNGDYRDQGDAFSGAVAKLEEDSYNMDALGED